MRTYPAKSRGKVVRVTAPEDDRTLDTALDILRRTLTALENMSTRAFSRGADKPLRDEMRAFLKSQGIPEPAPVSDGEAWPGRSPR